MNPMLKLAYDYGCQLAVSDMEKTALPLMLPGPVANLLPAIGRVGPNYAKDAVKAMGSLDKFRMRNPFTLPGAGYGALSGAVSGYANSEDGKGLRGALSGALGGAALGGAAGHFGAKALMGKNQYYMGKKLRNQGMVANRVDKVAPAQAAMMRDQMGAQALANSKELGPAGLKFLAGVSGAGVAGGLGAGYLSGANDKPWYQRMNPFG